MALLPGSANLATVVSGWLGHAKGQSGEYSSITLACKIVVISSTAARRVGRLSALFEQCGVRVRLVLHRRVVLGAH